MVGRKRGCKRLLIMEGDLGKNLADIYLQLNFRQKLF